MPVPHIRGVHAGSPGSLASLDHLDVLLWLNRNGIRAIQSLALVITITGLFTQNTGSEGWPRQSRNILLNFLEESLQDSSYKMMVRIAKDIKISPAGIVSAMTASGRPVKHTKDTWTVGWHWGPHPCLHTGPWGACNRYAGWAPRTIESVPEGEARARRDVNVQERSSNDLDSSQMFVHYSLVIHINEIFLN